MPLIKLIPPEIYKKIYKFINPISKIHIVERKVLFCIKCGEVLKNGDWFFNLEDEEYIIYECDKCKEENIFYTNRECDIILNQETK